MRISDWSSDVCSSDLLAERYAQSLFEAFVGEPQLIAELLRGRLGPHAEVDILEQFVEALGAHGFTVNESATLFHSLGMLTLGDASGANGLNASVQNGEPWHRLMSTKLAESADAELTTARAVTAHNAAATWQLHRRISEHAKTGAGKE